MSFQDYLDNNKVEPSIYYDELIDEAGNFRSHWSKLSGTIKQMGLDELRLRQLEVERVLRENGVTINVYGDPEGMNRPWMLDPIPTIFSETDWAVIEKGMQQRAELLNLIFLDLYSERRLLKQGILPLNLIYNHEGFLRQADGIKYQNKHALITYSADMARGPDGKMWILNDRTDAPSGSGYTLENRAAMTRVFPELIRENSVRKLSGYYQTLKNTLSSLAPNNKENPRIVLLSPGAGNQTYFEHAYLSSFIGVTLAFGEDLTVRDGYVWLKTLEGLVKVDVIVRRVDDIYCDPLEFMQGSQLGVMGLMESVRKGKVAVVNPFGCRALENSGLMAFLPNICKYFFNQDLILPSVATWWCGQEKEKNYVLEHLDLLIIKKIYRKQFFRSVYGGALSKDEKENLIAEIKANPDQFVGQEIVNFSTTPSLINGNIESRNSVFRSFMVSDVEKGEYSILPGGLSRSSPSKGVFIVSNEAGGISKDTWVQGINVIEKNNSRIVQPVSNMLPSRTGESLFWLGRYLERSANIARLMRVVLRKYNEATNEELPGHDKIQSVLFQSLTHLTSTYPGFLDPKGKELSNPEPELLSLALDRQKGGGLSFSLDEFLKNSHSVRDRLSLDTWRIVGHIEEDWNQIRRKPMKNLRAVYNWLDQLMVHIMAFNGLNLDNMTREGGWHLLNAGRQIESAFNAAVTVNALLGVKYSPEVEAGLMESLLVCNESLVTYRYRNRSNWNPRSVLHLLLLDSKNPRSLIFQLERIQKSIANLPQQSGNGELSTPLRSIFEAIMHTRLLELDKLLDEKKSGQERVRSNLVTVLNKISQLIFATADSVGNTYFNHLANKYSMMHHDKIPEI